MDLVQIRYFLALARTLNFTRAAEQCNVSQPALTKSIQRLESELGGALLLRERNLTQLTELGRAMLPLLEQISVAAEIAKAQALSFNRQEVSPLRLGLGPALSAAAFAPLLAALSEWIKGLELTLSAASGEHFIEQMLQGELDAMLTAGIQDLPERLNRWTLFSDRVVVVLPLAHPLASLPAVPGAALHDRAVLAMTAPDCPAWSVLDQLRRQFGVSPRTPCRGANLDHVHQMVLAGLGVALSMERVPIPLGLVARPLVEPSVEREIVLASVAGRPVSRAVDAFVKLARAKDWSTSRGR